MYSIGHSNHSWEHFLALLRQHSIDAIADVRSSPSSKYPHFSKSELKQRLIASEIKYVFLGVELGGRPNSLKYFNGTRADYDKMAQAPEYGSGIERLIEGAQRYSIAMMCSEHNPLDCHRCLLVGRTLLGQNVDTLHILSNGDLKTQSGIERELLSMANADTLDMFASADEKISDAYKARARKIAYDSSSEGGQI
ncbi:DUF488 domain-containing protein [Henriciella sp.]|uniref:DUF488 domain-containing protein n=1 Tax=Henriciella sp. TaxID=1968823 RepID=UPI00178F397E|nr:DUF488 domain-containing protein [Henriciella sp.]HIG22500.1 DUF488 domain-containing protein [Henriciella sp.]